ncbi:GGDEF domain-containing protein [Marinobacter oulmenensis]|uniref:diguanylate cyclase n=1 Tax=Marinobacter oulmenensis TaxID=643747 RepID=A0A840UCD6_9GAMM|nr:GGDEF domain-containing protein [Marinobacter oulmenensis]MBB5322692.1 diguanylate cyclase (GGDEF)-like protein [Marinobacter oulmenensis]
MPQLAEHTLPDQVSRAGLALLALTSGLCLFLGEPLSAAVAAAGAGLCLTGTPLNRFRHSRPWPQVRIALFTVLVIGLLMALWLGPWSLSHWLYVLPLVTFAVMPERIAAITLAALVAVILIMTQWLVTLPERHQMVTAFALTALLATLFVFLREYRARQLAPLRRTDELTCAASREYLSADLHKEIQRSEREGSNLSVIMIGLDNSADQAEPDEDIQAMLPRVGRYLHSHLRDFDTCYRVNGLEFLAILPGVNTSDAQRTAEQIRKGVSAMMTTQGLRLNVSTGVSGLNIGDDARSLQSNASNALRRARQQNNHRAAPQGPEDIQR